MGGIGGWGGEMFNPYSSPGDPLFYLHHAWLDKVWWRWQEGDLVERTKDITGRRHMSDDEVEGEMVGLEDRLRMMGVVPDRRGSCVSSMLMLRRGRAGGRRMSKRGGDWSRWKGMERVFAHYVAISFVYI